jgi:hypothetical protein
MSHYIPVFFFPVEKSQVLKVFAAWEDALPFMKGRLENRRKFGLRESVSRNWWHQHALDLLCRGLQIGGLEFINSEIVCLCDDGLKAASKALDAVLTKIADGIPNLGSFEHSDIEGLRIPEHRSAIGQAKPDYEIRVEADWGFEATVGFYSFVKSLREAICEAIAENKCLIYVRIQP